jgi:hypothetical protein
MCGEEMCHDIKTSSGRWSSDVPCGLHDAAVQGGYESYHLFDTTIYTFSFCEKCLRQLFIQCKIKPEISDMDIDTSTTREEDWARDQESYEDRVWRDAGGHHQAYLDRKCNGLKDCPNQAEYTRLYRGDFTEECRCEAHKDRYFQANVHQNTKFVPNVLKPFL